MENYLLKPRSILTWNAAMVQLVEQLICNYMPHGIRHLSFKGF